ncbi:hypothetical protein PoB_003596600 [Plakobranchus ocellatus]|uniref:Uncharacterized protein n=1 Tax=Plakobranchus ocellatus TaxID=259542 RepID=A0AAV4AE33_9GAST|nr:hypothetical protein PoB_003596600 [Plakobranchus ocellatus]
MRTAAHSPDGRLLLTIIFCVYQKILLRQGRDRKRYTTTTTTTRRRRRRRSNSGSSNNKKEKSTNNKDHGDADIGGENEEEEEDNNNSKKNNMHNNNSINNKSGENPFCFIVTCIISTIVHCENVKPATELSKGRLANQRINNVQKLLAQKPMIHGNAANKVEFHIRAIICFQIRSGRIWMEGMIIDADTRREKRRLKPGLLNNHAAERSRAVSRGVERCRAVSSGVEIFYCSVE